MAANSFAGGEVKAQRAAHALAFAYLTVFALLLVVLGAIAGLGRPTDGEPMAGIDVSRQPTGLKSSGTHTEKVIARAAPTLSPMKSPSFPLALEPQATIPPPPPITKPELAGHSLVADPALIEQTAQGPLPRIAQDGRTPMSAYAPAVQTSKTPRIAIVIAGLGLSAKATTAAIQGLPPGVTLAFEPYETDVQHWVDDARQAGHEVLLEVPMEPFDFPDSDPGPHTLRAAVGEQTNTERLTWSLTRFTGYAGITNLLGGRLLADPDSLSPVMTYIARRGLLFFDSGPEAHSVAPDVARRLNAPYVQSALTLDTVQNATEIDAQLSELEQLARTNGSAAGAGFVYPVTVGRVANWAKGLAGRGFVLVPASAIVAASK